MERKERYLIFVFVVIIATTCLSPWVMGVDPCPPYRRPMPSAPVNATESIGRYQLSGDWRLDTATGEVERVGDVYQQHKKPAAKCGYKCAPLPSGLEPLKQ